MTTLALDLGQNIGWCRGSAVGPLDFGTFPMKETSDLGLWLQGSDSFLMNIMKGVDDIAVEQPFLGDSYFPARKLISLLGHVYYHARFQGIAAQHVNEIAVSSGKKALSGYGKADKDQMIQAACDFWGFEAEEIDEHIADASGILKFHLFGSGPPSRNRKTRSSPGRSILRGPAR